MTHSEPSSGLRLYRIDPRLIHSTLTNAWVPATRAERVIVVDGIVERDPRKRTILELSASQVVRVEFCSEEGAFAVQNQLREKERVIVLFSTLANALRAQSAGLKIPAIHLGHVPSGKGRRELHPAVYLGQEELAQVKELEARKVEVYVQALPNDPRILPPFEPKLKEATECDVSTPPPQMENRTMATPQRAEDTLEVINERGLHLRAAHVLAALASSLSSDVRIGRPGALVNAKSLLGLTTLGATKGTKLLVILEGTDAENGLQQIRAIFQRGFDENQEGEPKGRTN